MPRTVSPELFKNWALMQAEDKTQLPLTLILLAIYMYSDREGRFVWDANSILFEMLPTKTGLNIDAALYELMNLNLIQKYTHKDESGSEMTLGFVVDWHSHQNINGREKASQLPPPNSGNLTAKSPPLPHAKAIESTAPVQSLFGDDITPMAVAPKQKKQSNIICYRGVFYRIQSFDGTVGMVLLSGEFDESPAVDDIAFHLSSGEISYISSEKYNQYQKAYPGVDILLRMKSCAQWTVDNPRKRKTHAGLTAFINQWLTNAQNKNQGLSHSPYTSSKPGSIDRVTGAVERMRHRFGTAP